MDFLKDITYEIKHIDRHPKAIRRFGFILAGLLFLMAGFLWYQNRESWTWWTAGGLASLLASLLFPKVIQPFYMGLTALTIPIGYVISRLILITMFVIFFVPVGLLSRLFGRDLLDRRLNKKATTYWLNKQHDPTPLTERYERLF